MCSFIPHRAGTNSSVYPLPDLQVRHGCWWPFLQDKALLLLAKPSTLLWNLGPLIS